MVIMFRLIVIALALLFLSGTASSQLYFPPIDGDKWETVSFAELEWNEAELDTLLRYVERNDSKAFIVLKDGKIAIEWYADGFLQSDLWYWASAGKTVTATLVGIAQNEGLLDINEPTSAYLGEGWTSLPSEDENKITVWNQLTMTSGLDDRNGDAFCTDAECLVYKADPGTRWAYHNAPYTLLDEVIANATEVTLNRYYTTKIATRVGMNGLFIKSGFNNVLTTTPRSMARFGLLALNNFVWDGTPILDDTEYVQAMTTRSQEINKSYGYLWWLNGQESFMLPVLQVVFPGPITPNAPADTYNGLGKNDQILSVSPSEGLVVVRMGNVASPDGALVPTSFPNEMWGLLQNVMRTPTSVEEDSDETELAVRVGSSGVEVLNGHGPYTLSTILGEQVLTSPQPRFGITGLSSGAYILTDMGTGESVKLLL